MSSAGCCDDGCSSCDGCFEGCECGCFGEYRNQVASVTSGLLFALGWWFLIDASVNADVQDKHQAIGVMSTIGLFMVNAISGEMLEGNMYSDGCLGSTGARVWLLFGLVISFGSLISAIWVMVDQYINHGQDYAGAAVFLQNCLIFISSVIFKFGRGDSSNGYF
eukprot:m.4611 g.4611  ORF g.4611 m.4611 type:complete len:164 (-) comp2263_c0_seq1:1030-1521(-)